MCYLRITQHVLNINRQSWNVMESRRVVLQQMFVIPPSEDWTVPTDSCHTGQTPLYLITAHTGGTCTI